MAQGIGSYLFSADTFAFIGQLHSFDHHEDFVPRSTRPCQPNADTCRTLILPKLYAVGWSDDQISEQRSFTDGRIVVHGNRAVRKKGKRADYILRKSQDLWLAVVEVKPENESAATGLQQAKDYAEILKLKFAYASNGREIIEFDFTTGLERTRPEFPAPEELWDRLSACEGLADETAALPLLTPPNLTTGKEPRYYQQIAINRAVQAIIQGEKRVFLTMATGTGKTVVAFQICWKLWSSRWNRSLSPHTDSLSSSTEERARERSRKFYFDGGQVEIAADLVYELDADGKQLRVVKLTEYTGDKVRSICPSTVQLRAGWCDPKQRAEIIAQLAELGIDFKTLALQAGKPDADPFHLLPHLAYNAPILTRRPRADRVKKQQAAMFNYLQPEAGEILNELLEKYAADGELQFVLPDVLKVPPISRHGSVGEIVEVFGGPNELRMAVNQLQTLLYAE